MRTATDFAIQAGLVVALVVAGPVWTEGQAGRRGDVLDANTASEKQLASVPGLSPPLVKDILQGRPFLAVTDLDVLLSQGLDPARRADVYRRLFVQVNLNSASDAELLLIPGVGSGVAGEIKAPRPFRSLAQFRRAIGKAVDEKEATRIEQYVFVPINLNTASDADILSIPGVGQRMLAEFKEYRPYKAIQQFRREIGKYVDDKEVARLERYVTLD